MGKYFLNTQYKKGKFIKYLKVVRKISFHRETCIYAKKGKGLKCYLKGTLLQLITPYIIGDMSDYIHKYN